jgi:hypothetical protein
MRFFRTSLIKLLVFLWIATTIFSCRDQPGKWANADIPSGKREGFHELNDQLMEAVKANNAKQAEIMMSNEMLKSLGSQTARVIELLSLRSKSGKYKVLDEYYISYGLKVPYQDSIASKARGINDYSLNFPVPYKTKQLYFAFLLPEGNDDQWVITAMYAKFNYGWKLTELNINPYKLEGKTSPELYIKAKQEHAQKRLVDAINTMDVASKCFLPNGMWRYKIGEEMGAYSAKLTTEFYNKYQFPIVLRAVPTKPRVFKILTQAVDNKYYPQIWYQSSINLNDTAAVRKENDQIKKVIDQQFDGLSQHKKYVFYSAYSMPVKGKMMGRPVNFTDKR